MLGAEPEIIETYVKTGEVQLIFIDALDSVRTATDIHTVAHCMGLQDPALFWAGHDLFFRNQSNYYSADVPTLIERGAELGADRAQLEACYESGEGLAGVQALADIRDERGVAGRPVFDIGEQRLFGNQSFETFARAIEAAQP